MGSENRERETASAISLTVRTRPLDCMNHNMGYENLEREMAAEKSLSLRARLLNY